MDDLRRLAEQGDAEAQKELGKAYLKIGLGKLDFSQRVFGFVIIEDSLEAHRMMDKEILQATIFYLK